MTTTATSGGQLGVGSRWPCLKIPSEDTTVTSDSKTAQSGLFIRVHPITLGANDHHGHLEGSLGDPEPLTLPQNAIGNLRGDVRLDLCQSDLFNF
ncbi:hypothetical protein CDL15_Pgr011661 [Punica granatum]|uniref:Uncharacterized protein n=1 Tax=Punica granatum TaxID=22663 RepID=A0A218WWC8_PUNGR|nr:hypothetical protein CDL15_Pgr011661 [Punica granatum]